MDPILNKMDQVRWLYADKDPDAVAELERRIAKAATNEQDPTISYSELVDGVLFALPGGQTYEIKDFQNHGFESQLIGDYLGYICKRSYEKGGFMASAIVVLKDEKRPSSHFFQWMNKLGALVSRNDDAATEFWLDQVGRTHRYYSQMVAGSD